MKIVAPPSLNPEENIALDELLLAKAETGRAGETLRFWTQEDHFVVLGRAGKIDEDCDTEACARDGVRLIRRISGGGTVLQGPGCINYSAVLSYARDEKTRDVRYSYSRVLGDISRAFRKKDLDVDFLPISDLAVGGKKVSGNAQARKKKYFLHHGTFLVGFDLDRVSRYLKHPRKEPGYRKGRAHSEFLANIPVPADELKGLISEVFRPSEGALALTPEDLEELRNLVTRKYSTDRWNLAF